MSKMHPSRWQIEYHKGGSVTTCLVFRILNVCKGDYEKNREYRGGVFTNTKKAEQLVGRLNG